MPRIRHAARRPPNHQGDWRPHFVMRGGVYVDPRSTSPIATRQSTRAGGRNAPVMIEDDPIPYQKYQRRYRRTLQAYNRYPMHLKNEEFRHFVARKRWKYKYKRNYSPKKANYIAVRGAVRAMEQHLRPGGTYRIKRTKPLPPIPIRRQPKPLPPIPIRRMSFNEYVGTPIPHGANPLLLIDREQQRRINNARNNPIIIADAPPHRSFAQLSDVARHRNRGKTYFDLS